MCFPWICSPGPRHERPLLHDHSYRPSATRATSRKGKGMWDLPLLGPITTGSDYPKTLLGSALHRVAAARSGTTKAPDSPLSTLCTSRTPCNVVVGATPPPPLPLSRALLPLDPANCHQPSPLILCRQLWVVLSTVVARSSSSDPPLLVQHEWLSSSRAVDKTRAARPYLHKG